MCSRLIFKKGTENVKNASIIFIVIMISALALSSCGKDDSTAPEVNEAQKQTATTATNGTYMGGDFESVCTEGVSSKMKNTEEMSTWTVFFYPSDCSQKNMSVTFTRYYKIGAQRETDVYEMDYTYEKIEAVVLSESYVAYMNSGVANGLGYTDWQFNIPKDLTGQHTPQGIIFPAKGQKVYQTAKMYGNFYTPERYPHSLVAPEGTTPDTRSIKRFEAQGYVMERK